jgi:hypothetical protein
MTTEELSDWKSQNVISNTKKIRLSKLLFNTKPIKFKAYQYHAADKTQFYLFLGKGVHSNNARVM